jgi:alpha-1,6-mannosyltransferase
VCLPALWIRFRRHPFDPLVVLFVLASLVVAAGWVTGAFALGRAWPGVLLAGQVALGVELPRMGTWLRRTWVPITAVSMAIGSWYMCGNLVYGLPFSRGHLPAKVRAMVETTPEALDYSFVRSYAQRGDVILTDDFYCVMTLPGYGLRTVAPAWPDPFLHDVAQRKSDLHTMVTPSTPVALRRELMARYHIKWIITTWYGSWTPDTWGMPEVQFVTTGPERLRFYRVAQA